MAGRVSASARRKVVVVEPLKTEESPPPPAVEELAVRKVETEDFVPQYKPTHNRHMPVYPPPESLEEAIQRDEVLLRAVHDIELQLGNRNRTDLQGRRLSPDEYFKWKTRAHSSKIAKEGERRFLERWIRDYKMRTQAVTATQALGLPEIDETNPEHVVFVLYKVLEGVLSTIEDTKPEEVAALELGGKYVLYKARTLAPLLAKVHVEEK